MARPKVPDDKRQRTAQACNICKRRKQKCNGKSPCNTCVKRHLSCEYSPANAAEVSSQGESSTKRRQTENAARSHHPASPGTRTSTERPLRPQKLPQIIAAEPQAPSGPLLHHREMISQTQALESVRRVSRGTTSSEPDEEAEVYKQTRMLQDPRGRLLYVGDSATLSFLQLIRMIVEASAGFSPFTMDPNRHKIMEATSSVSSHVRQPCELPNKRTAQILAQAYFTNTHGLVEVFDRPAFWRSLDACYADPRSVGSSQLCLVYLTMAIGLVLATPLAGSEDSNIVSALRADPVDKAELFFRAARRLGDPTFGFEDADFWSVQALCLMSIYMLAVSKRNAAYAYYGMAVRTAFALGLHRSCDTSSIFTRSQRIERQNLWRSLFVLDRFLAASLGRPAAIAEEDCSENSLEAPVPIQNDDIRANGAFISARSLDAAVRTCQSIGRILKRIYSKRKVTTKLAQKIAGECEAWMKDIHKDLDPKKLFDGSVSPSDGVAILHVQLLGCHSIILLTRPFFLFLLIKSQREKDPEKAAASSAHKGRSRLERFSEACVAASIHTLSLVHAAFESNYVPRRNPFILYFLFAAALVVMSNEFACLFRHDEYDKQIDGVMQVITYCARTDVQANRLLFILQSFKDVIHHAANPSAFSREARPLRMDMSQGFLTDPLASLATAPHLGSFLEAQEQANMAPFAVTRRVRHSTVTRPAHHNHSAGRQFQPSSPPPEEGPSGFTRGVSTGSSHSGHTSSTHTRLAKSGQPSEGGEASETLSGGNEFDFDSLWDFPPTASAFHHHVPSRSMVFGPDNVPRSTFEQTSEVAAHHPASSQLQPTTTTEFPHSPDGLVIDPHIPMYPPAHLPR